jgi:hypothetical protein
VNTLKRFQWLILWVAFFVVFYVALRLAPLERPMLFHDWRISFKRAESLTYYPPWTWWIVHSLDLPALLAITLASYAVAVLRRARSVASAALTFFCLPLWWTIFLGQLDGLALLGVLGLPWLVPLVLLKPLVAAFALLSRWRWTVIALAFAIVSILVFGLWPIDLVAYHLGDPPEVWPQEIGLGLLGLPLFVFLVWKMPRDDQDWWMLAGSTLSPYLIAYHWMPLMPAAARLPWYWTLAITLTSWLTFASNWLGEWAWYLGWVSVLLLGVGLWLHGGEPADRAQGDRAPGDDFVTWAGRACLWIWRKGKHR